MPGSGSVVPLLPASSFEIVGPGSFACVVPVDDVIIVLVNSNNPATCSCFVGHPCIVSANEDGNATGNARYSPNDGMLSKSTSENAMIKNDDINRHVTCIPSNPEEYKKMGHSTRLADGDLDKDGKATYARSGEHDNKFSCVPVPEW